MSEDSELQADDLLLKRFYRHAGERPDATYLTQPLADGSVKTWTFAETLSEAQRMAAYLGSLDLEPQSRIAILTKNCAHFFMTDLAIWMAGHVSVALYPTLTDDTVRYIWNTAKPGCCSSANSTVGTTSGPACRPTCRLSPIPMPGIRLRHSRDQDLGRHHRRPPADPRHSGS